MADSTAGTSSIDPRAARVAEGWTLRCIRGTFVHGSLREHEWLPMVKVKWGHSEAVPGGHPGHAPTPKAKMESMAPPKGDVGPLEKPTCWDL